jgi:hypothetical protein
MPTPVPNYASFDFSNTSSYPGTGNTLYDLSGLGNNLTNTSGLSAPVAGTGQSKYYSFTGGADQFWKYNCSTNGFVAGKLYTAAEFLWIRTSNWTGSGYQCFAGWGDDIGAGGGQLGIWRSVSFDPNKLTAMMGSGVAVISLPTAPSVNEWHHFGYVADGSACTFYLDGTAVGSIAQNSTWPSGTGITGYVGIVIPQAPFMALGALANNYYPASNFDLAVAEFFNTSLTGIEVTDLYNSQASRFSGAPPPYVGSVGGRRFGGRFAG